MEKLKKAFKAAFTNPVLWVVGIYLLYPTDFIVDSIPTLGNLDDLAVFVGSLLLQDLMGKNGTN